MYFLSKHKGTFSLKVNLESQLFKQMQMTQSNVKPPKLKTPEYSAVLAPDPKSESNLIACEKIAKADKFCSNLLKVRVYKYILSDFRSAE